MDESSHFDSGSIADIDADAFNNCLVVDPEIDVSVTIDDAGVEDGVSDALKIVGLITHQGDCLSGVVVCIKFDFSTSAVATDRYGQFSYDTGNSYEPGYWYIRPRKIGYKFEPKFLTVEPDDAESNMITTNFTAVKLEFPPHATGRWQVISDTSGEDSSEIGKIYEFKGGCLFGGSDCVMDFYYTDEDAFCESAPLPIGYPYNTGSAGSRTGANTGEFDPETQSWTITRTGIVYIPFPGANPRFPYTRVSNTLVLERVD